MYPVCQVVSGYYLKVSIMQQGQLINKTSTFKTNYWKRHQGEQYQLHQLHVLHSHSLVVITY